MNLLCRVGLAFVFFLGPATGASAPEQHCGIAIVGGTLIDGNGAAPVQDYAVLVRGNRIAAVGPKAGVAIPPCAETINAAGKTVLPGLINSNTHLSLSSSSFLFLTGSDAGASTEADSIKKLPRAEQNIRRSLNILLMQGVTSIRDTNGFGKPLLAVKKAVDRNEFPGSRMFLGTLSICAPAQYERIMRDVGPYGEAIMWTL